MKMYREYLRLILRTGSSYAPLFMRLGIGVMFFMHGYMKFNGGLGGTAGFFKMVGLVPSYPLAVLVALAETFGGLALIAGFLVKPASIALAVEMLVAAITVHIPNGFFINWAGTPGIGNGFEFQAVLIPSLITLVIYGSGLASVDHWLYDYLDLDSTVTDEEYKPGRKAA